MCPFARGVTQRCSRPRAGRSHRPARVITELEAALAMRQAGTDAKALRRVLRRIEELLDE